MLPPYTPPYMPCTSHVFIAAARFIMRVDLRYLYRYDAESTPLCLHVSMILLAHFSATAASSSLKIHNVDVYIMTFIYTGQWQYCGWPQMIEHFHLHSGLEASSAPGCHCPSLLLSTLWLKLPSDISGATPISYIFSCFSQLHISAASPATCFVINTHNGADALPLFLSRFFGCRRFIDDGI